MMGVFGGIAGLNTFRASPEGSGSILEVIPGEMKARTGSRA